MAETTETTTESGVDAFSKPFLQYGMTEALRQYQQGAPQFYQGQTYAGFTPQQEQAMRMQEERAIAGSPLVQQAQATMGSFLGSTDPETGQYIPPVQSGLLSGAIERALEPVRGQLASSFAMRGRAGSGLAAQEAARTLGNVAADVAYRDYATQRGQAMQAAQLAPALAAADYSDIARLQQVGQQRQALAEKGIQEAMQRYQYEQTSPMEQLERYQNVIAGFPMGQQTTTVTPYYTPSRGQQFLSGYLGATGAGIDNPYLRIGAGLLAQS